MAMIKCPECGKELSDKAASCPNCGCPMEDIKSRLEEMQAEREEQLKAKEEEKKAKDLAAQIKKQKQEEARAAVTPETKKKRAVIGVVAAIVAVVAIVLVCYFGIKIPKDRAYQEYLAEIEVCNESIANYNDALNAYNSKAEEVISANDELDSAINEAQAVVDSGETPYEGEKVTVLSNTLKEARNNRVTTPSFAEMIDTVVVDEDVAKSGKTAIDEVTAELDSISQFYKDEISNVNEDTEALVIPDYSAELEVIASQQKELEDSYAIQKQIMEPSEDWVITRLGRVENVATIAPVTEEHDPNGKLNKAGGYTATVYFMSPLLGTQELTGDALIDKGTLGGGAIEVYRTVEDAESRDTYLGALDGGILSSGSHKVLGTMVIRTSDDLKASEQETLTNAIVAAMIELD